MNSDDHYVSIDELFARKLERRRQLADLPIEEKVAIVVKLQQVAHRIAKQTGRPCREPWVLDEPSEESR